jgi:hypothetical protein
MVPSHEIREALASTLEATGLNQAQRLALYNADPEINSLAEKLVTLRAYGVPVSVIRELLGDVRTVLALNDAEGGHARSVAGRLDDLATALAHAERNQQIVTGPSIKRLADQLRPHLATLRSPDAADGTAYAQASMAVRSIVKTCPRTRLEVAVAAEGPRPRSPCPAPEARRKRGGLMPWWWWILAIAFGFVAWGCLLGAIWISVSLLGQRATRRRIERRRARRNGIRVPEVRR